MYTCKAIYLVYECKTKNLSCICSLMKEKRNLFCLPFVAILIVYKTFPSKTNKIVSLLSQKLLNHSLE